MRFAIYFVPPPGDPLGQTAARWLGRDPHTGDSLPGAPVGRLTAEDVAFHTAAARRYGFHATMKAPFRLARDTTETALEEAFRTFCSREASFVVPCLKIDRIGPFFALVPARPAPEIEALACKTVMAFERFRAPLSDAELARRQPDRLSVAQLRNLHRWGYPHVLDTFRFHMTLSGPVPHSDQATVQAALDEWFAPVIGQPLHFGSLSLMTEAEPGAPFLVRHYCPLATLNERMSA
ncbi:MAG: DUF1045 domain-containing protein [Minwuia sp.]|nr:DUF1045 domain-containing protein [Minwuia sp.]